MKTRLNMLFSPTLPEPWGLGAIFTYALSYDRATLPILEKTMGGKESIDNWFEMIDRRRRRREKVVPRAAADFVRQLKICTGKLKTNSEKGRQVTSRTYALGHKMHCRGAHMASFNPTFIIYTTSTKNNTKSSKKPHCVILPHLLLSAVNWA